MLNEHGLLIVAGGFMLIAGVIMLNEHGLLIVAGGFMQKE